MLAVTPTYEQQVRSPIRGHERALSESNLKFLKAEIPNFTLEGEDEEEASDSIPSTPISCIANFYTKQTPSSNHSSGRNTPISIKEIRRSSYDSVDASTYTSPYSSPNTNHAYFLKLRKIRMETYRSLKANLLANNYSLQQESKVNNEGSPKKSPKLLKENDVPVNIRMIGDYKATNTPLIQRYTYESMDFKLFTYIAHLDNSNFAKALLADVDVLIYFVDMDNIATCKKYFSERRRVPVPVVLAVTMDSANADSWQEILEAAQQLNVYGCMGYTSTELNMSVLFELAIQAFLDTTGESLSDSLLQSRIRQEEQQQQLEKKSKKQKKIGKVGKQRSCLIQ